MEQPGTMSFKPASCTRFQIYFCTTYDVEMTEGVKNTLNQADFIVSYKGEGTRIIVGFFELLEL